MERRSFLKKAGLVGLAATPTAAAEPAKPRRDIFSRKPLTPEQLLDCWYDSAFTSSPQTLMQAIATDEFCRLVPEPRLRRAPADVRKALRDLSVRAHRIITPRFFIDLYDNQTRPPHIVGSVSVPLATEPMNHYVTGSAGVIENIKSTLLEGVRDLVRDVKDRFPGTAMAGPEVYVELRGPVLDFYLYTHVLQPVPPQSGEGRVA